MNKPSLYRRCREAFNRFARDVIFAPTVYHCRFEKDKATDPSSRWALNNVYEKVYTCQNLGHEVLLRITDNGDLHIVSRPKRPESLPDMARALPPPDRFRKGGYVTGAAVSRLSRVAGGGESK